MDEVCTEILEHCLENYVSLKPLYNSIPRSTIYLHLKNELVKDKLIEKRGSKYKTTTKGNELVYQSKKIPIRTKHGKISSLLRRENYEPPEPQTESSLRYQVQKYLGEIKNNPMDRDFNLKKLKMVLDQEKISIGDLNEYIGIHKILRSYGLTEKIALAFGEEIENHGTNVRKIIDEVAPKLERFRDLRIAIGKSLDFEEDLLDENEKREKKISELNHIIQVRGSTPERIEELLELESRLINSGISLNDVNNFIQIYQELQHIGFNLDSAHIIAQELERIGLEIPDGIGKIIHYIEKCGSLEEAIQLLDKELRDKRIVTINLTISVNKLKNEKENLIGLNDKLEKKQKELRQTIGEQFISIKANERELSNLEKYISNSLQVRNNVDEINNAIKEQQLKYQQLLEENDKWGKKLGIISNKYESIRTDIETYYAWHDFLLSKKRPHYDSGFWFDLECLIKIHKGEAKHLEFYSDFISEKVWKKLVQYHENLVKEKVVSE